MKRLTSRAEDFEDSIREELSKVFGVVEHHKRVEGLSGIKWKVDFLAESNLVVEVSVQRRLETKIDSTFLKFVDITKRHQGFKAVLIFEDLYVGYHRSPDKKFFPTSEYRTMINHGFPILTPKGIPRLPEFQRGVLTSWEVSSRPNDFNLRSLSTNRTEVGGEIVRILAGGPLTRQEIAKATGKNPFFIVEVIQTLPQVKKLSCYYALSYESILKKLVEKGGKNRTPVQKKIVADWLRSRFLQTIRERGRCKTRELASQLGLDTHSLAQTTHQLCRGGVIRRQGKGSWELIPPTGQETLSQAND